MKKISNFETKKYEERYFINFCEIGYADVSFVKGMEIIGVTGSLAWKTKVIVYLGGDNFINEKIFSKLKYKEGEIHILDDTFKHTKKPVLTGMNEEVLFDAKDVLRFEGFDCGLYEDIPKVSILFDSNREGTVSRFLDKIIGELEKNKLNKGAEEYYEIPCNF